MALPSVAQLYNSGGRYLVAKDLEPMGQRRIAVIHQIEVRPIRDNKEENKFDNRLVLILASKTGQPWPKEAIVKPQNALALSNGLGGDPNLWISKTIEIWSEMVPFGTRSVPGIKMQAAAGSTTQVPVDAPPGGGFSGVAALPTSVPGMPAVATAAPMRLPAGEVDPNDDLNDEIPF